MYILLSVVITLAIQVPLQVLLYRRDVRRLEAKIAELNAHWDSEMGKIEDKRFHSGGLNEQG